ncbi:O-antigen polymerase [Syntrophobotulus glycolicus DSM 8271]|uniref:O-antigen polymerase n=1 Tax=Syntrophobotulus glycolicus (strain DSM 8271 / FlGlyR) TaxID=645991 RepID=F0SZV0_SYNGF|nr:O-antigen ligase family protein [Syntrophobotulus glycolicus]ADY57271.1 O-antigen polymerase [Syntrophobotulus glycolicus DSM 8271]
MQWVLLIFTLMMLGWLGWKRPVWLVALLGVSIALEISSVFYPDLGILGTWLGGISGVSLTRFTSIAIILTALARIIGREGTWSRALKIVRSPVSIAFLVYLGLGILSLIYSHDRMETLGEVVRLLLLYFLFVGTAVIMDDRNILLPLRAVYITALVLAPLAFYEGLTGRLVWQGEHLLVEPVLRVNATFVDPNIFARFLILAIVANLVLQTFEKEREKKLLYSLSLPVLLGELALTSSRGGMLTLIVILAVALVLLPNRKAILGLGALGVFGSILFWAVKPEVLSRILALTQNLNDTSPQRLYLWKVGIAIFQDHPLIGTGLGTFQSVFLQEYAHYQTVAGATVSHTTILTIASELGIAGLLVLAGVFAALIFTVYKSYAQHGGYIDVFQAVPNQYLVAAGCFLWILTVFLSSQAEGRFFEDPVLWLAAAIIVVIGNRRSFI